MIAAGIDAGTQSIKVIVYDSSSKEIIASHAEPLELIVGEGGVREQKASWWTDAVRKCFLAIPADIRKRIGVISVSGQQHGFVPVAADGSVRAHCKSGEESFIEAVIDNDLSVELLEFLKREHIA